MTATNFKTFRNSQTVIARFITRRTIKMASIWGLVFGLFATSSAVGYVDIYKTAAARHQFASSFGNNIGITAIIGKPHNLETVLGFTAWRSLGIIILLGSIWAILMTTRNFRGEEMAGRWELFLTGKTTARRATISMLAGIGVSLLAMFVLVGLVTLTAAKSPEVHLTLQSASFFALTAILPSLIFVAVGALASQIQPTRSRAAMMSAAIFGLSFGLRAIGNITTATHWLVNVSPLGWVEQLRPLTGSRPLWLIPIIGFVLILSLLSIKLAGQRDLGASIVADKDTAKPHFSLLSSPLAASWRLSWLSIVPWLVGLTVFSTGFSALAKAAADAIKASSNAEQAIGRVSQGGAASTLFLGVMFLILMTIIMLTVTNIIANVREEEASGYLDNLLTRPVSRLQWLTGRVAIVLGVIVATALLITLGTWIGTSSVHLGVSLSSIVLASINASAPALFMLGAGILAFGFRPRLTSSVLYGIIAWSFAIQMLGSIGNLNHYLLDTSVLHHIALAPAVDPNWQTAYVLSVLGITGLIAGTWRFTVRDLENE